MSVTIGEIFDGKISEETAPINIKNFGDAYQTFLELQYEIIEEKYNDYQYFETVDDEDLSSEENFTSKNFEEIVSYFNFEMNKVAPISKDERKLWSYLYYCVIRITEERFYTSIYDACDDDTNICKFYIHDEDINDENRPLFEDIMYVKINEPELVKENCIKELG